MWYLDCPVTILTSSQGPRTSCPHLRDYLDPPDTLYDGLLVQGFSQNAKLSLIRQTDVDRTWIHQTNADFPRSAKPDVAQRLISRESTKPDANLKSRGHRMVDPKAPTPCPISRLNDENPGTGVFYIIIPPRAPDWPF
ncbi:unnamed protein product [Linum trigynum]|uniref:Uncharacterized protein n=1 Tax=Linum trigynum TaxID=586398 RepID=A0AAV2D725_9ROSI